jgi:hypothetical protein
MPVRPAYQPVAAVSGLDKGLAVGAAVVSVAALAGVLWIMMILNTPV